MAVLEAGFLSSALDTPEVGFLIGSLLRGGCLTAVCSLGLAGATTSVCLPATCSSRILGFSADYKSVVTFLILSSYEPISLK